MLPYTPQLCTLDYVRLHRGLKDAERTDDDLITGFIVSASAEFQEGIKGGGRVFVPYLATTYEDFEDAEGLDLDGDVLEIVELANGNGELVDLNALMTIPANKYPKIRVQVRRGSGAALAYVEEPLQALTLRAWRGCVPHYATGAFRRSGVVVPASGLTDSQASLDLVEGVGLSRFQIGQYIAIALNGLREMIQVTAISTDTVAHKDTLTLSRGELGTTPASYLENTVIEIYTPPADVMEAVRAIAVYKYLKKDAVGSRITAIDPSGVVTVEGLDPSVKEALARYRRIPLPRIRAV